MTNGIRYGITVAFTLAAAMPVYAEDGSAEESPTTLASSSHSAGLDEHATGDATSRERPLVIDYASELVCTPENEDPACTAAAAVPAPADPDGLGSGSVK